MAAPAKFLFDTDFAAPDKTRERAATAAEIAEKIAEAEARAYRAGYEAGWRDGARQCRYSYRPGRWSRDPRGYWYFGFQSGSW